MAEVNCSIVVPPNSTVVEVAANAFRLVQDSSQEWFLDFLQYTDESDDASVVTRIRVSEIMLTLIRNRLDETLGNPKINGWGSDILN